MLPLNIIFFAALFSLVQGRYASSNSSVKVQSRTFGTWPYIPLGPAIAPAATSPAAVTTRAACPSTDSDNFHKSCLYQINSARLTHNVPEVTYDDTLAAEAKKCADAFVRAVSLTTPVCSYLSSGVTVGANGSPPAQACRAVVGDINSGWYSEYVQGALTFPNPTYATGNQNLAQVIWKSTTKVGCGLSEATATFGVGQVPERVLVCLWDPAGVTPALYSTNVLEDTC